MKRLTTVLVSTLLGALALASAGPRAAAAPQVGAEAPDFSLPDAAGKTQSLSSFRGKYVVLEWTNPECPFVRKHYGSGNMPKLQKAAEAKGVVWLAIDSSAPGKEGYLDAAHAKEAKQTTYASCSALLLDPDGKIGRLYAAKATPHMFLIDPQGKLLYAGAIDSIPSADQGDIARATNYVKVGLDEALAHKTLTTTTTKAYGCSIKY